MLNLNRRLILKLTAASWASALLPKNAFAFTKNPIKALEAVLEKAKEAVRGTVGENIFSPPPVPNVRFAMVIDLGLGIGCRRCSYACKRENNVSDSINPPYIMVLETKFKPGGVDSRHEYWEEGRTDYWEKPGSEGLLYTKLRKDRMYMPVQCNHCDRAPCTRVCPTQATYKDKDGLVLMDYNKCIGCRYCMAACPYGARRFNWFEPHIPEERRNPLVPVRQHGLVEKCTFCVHRTRLGRKTRCVEVCPNKARTFGNLNDPNSDVAKLLLSYNNFRLKEVLNTEPRIFYITSPKEKKMQWSKPLPMSPDIRGIKK